jgi:hypothetical protein
MALGTKFISAEQIGLEECPYLFRVVVNFYWFALRFHRWEGSDDIRAFHTHPWWFATLVIWGGYVDISQKGRDVLGFLSFRFRRANHAHTVQITKRGTWTVLITGRPKQRWGFWVDGKLIKRDKYFARHGHHPCDPTGIPVRRKPDGTRIPI